MNTHREAEYGECVDPLDSTGWQLQATSTVLEAMARTEAILKRQTAKELPKEPTQLSAPGPQGRLRTTLTDWWTRITDLMNSPRGT